MRWKVFSAGTTSARSSDTLNKMIDLIELLATFWEEKEATGLIYKWNEEIQTEFINYCKSDGFLKSKSLDNDDLSKFARQKTSYLEQFGFVDANRKLTDLGKYLSLETVKDKYFPLLTNKQSSFLIGLLNMKNENDVFIFRNVMETLSEKEFLSFDELMDDFMWENPLSDIEIRKNIRQHLPIQNFENFKILIHHQKGDTYNIKYFDIFNMILNIDNSPRFIFGKIKSLITGMFGAEFLRLLFGTSKKPKPSEFLEFKIDRSSQEEILFVILKAKLVALKKEYFDLNKRAMIATGIFHFVDTNVSLANSVAKIVKQCKINHSSKIITTKDMFLEAFIDNELVLHNNIFEKNINDQKKIFENFLDESLTYEKVIAFLKQMSEGDYSEIDKYFDGSADNATYSEFITSVAFHYLTNRTNDFREAWNGILSLDNKPIRYASGGKADAKFMFNNIVYLVETTIQIGMQQVANEIAPISEHLFDTNHENKMAILFAKNISERAVRQADIQRKGKSVIYTCDFISLSDVMVEKLEFNESLERIINV